MTKKKKTELHIHLVLCTYIVMHFIWIKTGAPVACTPCSGPIAQSPSGAAEQGSWVVLGVRLKKSGLCWKTDRQAALLQFLHGTASSSHHPGATLIKMQLGLQICLPIHSTMFIFSLLAPSRECKPESMWIVFANYSATYLHLVLKKKEKKEEDGSYWAFYVPD
jgi:hypothetical protein